MGQNTVKTPCSPHLLTVVSCNGARVQAEARVVGARGLRRGSRGHTPIPKPWGDMQVAPRADGLKYLSAQQGVKELRSADKKTWLGRDRPKWHGTSGRYVCLCGRFRCFFASFGSGTCTQGSPGRLVTVCALCFLLLRAQLLLHFFGLTGSLAERAWGTGHALDRQARRYSAGRPHLQLPPLLPCDRANMVTGRQRPPSFLALWSQVLSVNSGYTCC